MCTVGQDKLFTYCERSHMRFVIDPDVGRPLLTGLNNRAELVTALRDAITGELRCLWLN